MGGGSRADTATQVPHAPGQSPPHPTDLGARVDVWGEGMAPATDMQLEGSLEII